MGRGSNSKNITKILRKAHLSSSKKANKAASKPLLKASKDSSYSREPRVYKKKFRKGKRIYVEYHNIKGELYNPDGPVREVYRLNGDLVEMAYPVRQSSFTKLNEERDRNTTDELLVKSWYKNNQVKSEIYLKEDCIHRIPDEGPAITKWYENGSLKEESYYMNGNPCGDEGHPVATFWDEKGNQKSKKSRV